MTKKKSKVCTDCVHCFTPKNNGMVWGIQKKEYKCAACQEEIVDHVTGKVSHKALNCRDVNTDGKCELYEAKPHIELREKLLKFRAADERCRPDYFGREQILGLLVDDLLRVLDTGKSDYFNYVSEDDTPFSVVPVLKKSVIERALSAYWNNADEAKDPFHDGCYVDKRSSQEIKKEFSWIEKMKKALKRREDENNNNM